MSRARQRHAERACYNSITGMRAIFLTSGLNSSVWSSRVCEVANVESRMLNVSNTSRWTGLNARAVAVIVSITVAPSAISADDLHPVKVEGQPLAANVIRVLQALETLGSPLPKKTVNDLAQAAKERDASQLQRLLDPHVLLAVSLNPESRVKVQRGPAPALLQQAGFTPVLVKVVNESTV